MKRVCVSIFSILLVFFTVDAKPLDSILTAASFPKNANDLTFRQRMDVLTDGYEDFDTEFDSNGTCIKNCPYVGMTLKDFEKRIEQTAQEVQEDISETSQPSTQGPGTSGTPNTEDGPGASSDKPDDENPETQDNPDNPETPETPERPETPEQPERPETPEHPERPERPENPGINPPQPPVNGTLIPTSCPVHVNPVRVSSEMGYRKKYKRNHNGMDLSISVNTPIYAAADGTVVIRRNEGAKKGYGNYLVIKHDRNYYTVYGHLNKWLVSQGDHVRAGQEIAKSGNTGNSSGPHLHFEVLKNAPLVRQGATPVNPRQITQCPWSPANR